MFDSSVTQPGVTTAQMKALPPGTRVWRTHNFNVKRKSPLLYQKIFDGKSDVCCFHQVKPNGTVVRRDQFLFAKEIALIPSTPNADSTSGDATA